MSLIKKIVITGPESSGKTTLAQQLAEHFSTRWVPEYARSFLAQLDRPYRREDLLLIAREQVRLEQELLPEARRYLFCDTGLEVIRIWSLVRYQSVDPQIEQLSAGCDYDYYLLCRPDLLWEPDPLRETPDPKKRWQLYEYYEQELNRSGIPWASISGTGESRLQRAVNMVNGL